MTAELNSILDRAVMCIVHVRQWGATQKDNEAGAELANAHGVTEAAYEVTRHLIDPKHLKEIDRQASRIRKFVQVESQPWTDGNGRLLPNERVPGFVMGLQDLIDTFDALADQFVVDLPTIYAESPLVVAGKVDVDDLLSPEQARARFYVDLRIRPIPSGSDFRVDMSSDLMKAIQQDCEDNLKEAAKLATLESFSRMRKVITTMINGLERHGIKLEGAARSQYLTEASVSNVVDLVGILDTLNIADDPNLTRIASDMRTSLIMFDADMLKDDPNLRDTVTINAKRVLKDVDAATEGLGGFFGIGGES